MIDKTSLDPTLSEAQKWLGYFKITYGISPLKSRPYFVVLSVDSCVPGDMVTITGVVKVSNAEEGKKGNCASLNSL